MEEQLQESKKNHTELKDDHEKVKSELKEKEAAHVMERMGNVNWSPDDKDDSKPKPPAATPAPASPAPVKEVAAMQKQLKSQTKRANDLES